MAANDSLAEIALGNKDLPMKPIARLMIALVGLSGCGHSGLPATPLFDGVEGANYAEGTQLIQDRLQSQFPAGSSERKLTEYLRQQGLKVVRTTGSSGRISGEASVKYGSSFCGSQVRVNWTAGMTNKVESIDTLYADTGCP
jgi:hypothetical protein